jgi:hypothetical protein
MGKLCGKSKTRVVPFLPLKHAVLMAMSAKNTVSYIVAQG